MYLEVPIEGPWFLGGVGCSVSGHSLSERSVRLTNIFGSAPTLSAFNQVDQSL